MKTRLIISLLVILCICCGIWGYLKFPGNNGPTAYYQKSDWSAAGFIKKLNLNGTIYEAAPTFTLTNPKTGATIAYTSNGEVIKAIIGENSKDCIFIRNEMDQNVYLRENLPSVKLTKENIFNIQLVGSGRAEVQTKEPQIISSLTDILDSKKIVKVDSPPPNNPQTNLDLVVLFKNHPGIKRIYSLSKMNKKWYIQPDQRLSTSYILIDGTPLGSWIEKKSQVSE
ncbi:hypothetical protein PP175_06695 [Aneurinibacillus sp. Ricciae_BoGa-3]|uniref:hypothetical protein n=1 Tax=Aneurinibacillus sp. Ricciae_BoGa-3 TaxID=3022697 RepID=UPI002340B121|nr:hypothetical protein [Aneurinibacillus sp. Ricciae_BoGa-3]WCK55624.1 hypothetical protein PP175_06695 [Aneurinibacillus sp. Ricciae_BoGa-3]